MSQEIAVTEMLAQITSPHFTAGIVLRNNVVVRAAPIVAYMQRWDRDRVRAYCCTKGWRVIVVRPRATLDAS